MARFGSHLIYHPKLHGMTKFERWFIWLFGSPMAGSSPIHWMKTIRKLSFRRVLDAGCGNGEYTFYLAERYPNSRVDACDIDDDKISYCQTVKKRIGLTNVYFFKCSLLDLDLAPRYDLIYCNHVLEHIPVSENRKVLSNFYAALKPGGWLYILRPTPLQRRYLPGKFAEQYEKWEEMEHIGVNVTLGEMTTMLNEIGFMVLSTEYTSGPMASVSFQLRQFLLTKPKLIFALFFPVLRGLSIGDTFIKHGRGNCFLILTQKQ